jgi:hypothetical protein
VLFVLDESSLSFVDMTADEATSSIEMLLDNLLACREEEQPVMRCVDVWSYTVLEGVQLYQFVFQNAGDLAVDRDLRQRLHIALDRCHMWDEQYEVVAVDVVINGETLFAPGIAFAHDRIRCSEAAACLPLPGAARAGRLEVAVGDRVLPISFVVTPAHRLDFYRDAFEIEDVGEEEYVARARLAFPDLAFADGLQAQWRRFSRAYRDLRPEVTRVLAGLNDHHVEVFRGHPAPMESQKRMSSLAHVDMSPESPNTRANRTAWRTRAITFNGRELYCEWHLKLTKTVDRIHFHPGLPGITKGPIVGIFVDHLPT